MAKQIVVQTARHAEAVKLSHIKAIDSDTALPEFVLLQMKPRHWFKDTWGSGDYHEWVVADREAVAKLLRLK